MQNGFIRAACFLTIILQAAGGRAAAKVLFSDDFERLPVGSQLSTARPVVGAGYTDTGNTTIVATQTLPGRGPGQP